MPLTLDATATVTGTIDIAGLGSRSAPRPRSTVSLAEALVDGEGVVGRHRHRDVLLDADRDGVPGRVHDPAERRARRAPT